MPTLSINDAEPGMHLAADVNDRNGRPLLKAGTELTDKHIKVFKTWGITQIQIQGDASQDPFQEILAAHPEYAIEADTVARELFQHTESTHPLIEGLLPVWKARYIKQRAHQA